MGARQTGKSTLARSEPFLADRPLPHARRSGNSGTRQVRRRGPLREGAPPHPGRGATRARAAPRRQARSGRRPPAPQRALPPHRLREPAPHAPRLRDARGPGGVHQPLAPDTRRAAGTGGSRDLERAAVGARVGVDRPHRVPPVDTRRLARRGTPGRLSDPGGGVARRRRPFAVVRRLPSHVPRTGPPDDGGHRQPRRFPAAHARGVPSPRHHGQPDRSRPRHPGPAGDGATLPQPAGDLLPACPPGGRTPSIAPSG